MLHSINSLQHKKIGKIPIVYYISCRNQNGLFKSRKTQTKIVDKNY